MEEVLIVKAKLYSVFSRGGGFDALRQIYGDTGPFEGGWNNDWGAIPNAPKMLRLGFHDCLKYSDGSGGCDGCLNWEGVGFRFEDSPNSWNYSNVGRTNNNGLGYTVEVLEAIYTDAQFPLDRAPALNASLLDTGKSRADLWALATIASVEFGIETNNRVCDDPSDSNPGRQCHHLQGEPGCKVTLPRPLQFTTGRSDCVTTADQPYKADKHESHPNAVGNGRETVDFFKTQFNMTGRETVALMGAHTFGRLHVKNSLLRYVWTSRGTHLFNNHYYKNIVRDDEYMFNDDECTKITDAEGRMPKTRWMAHVRKDTVNGGPVQWIHENYACPNCVANPGSTCCTDVPEGHFCKPDADTVEDDNKVNGGCEKYRFISGLDETALSCEIGMYFDFEVTDDGIPYGCPGFAKFNTSTWKTGDHLSTWSLGPKPGKPGRFEKHDPNCPLNMLAEPPGSTPVSAVFKEYAEDQDQWFDEFVPVLEKMLSNGYDGLASGPDQYTDVTCPLQNPHDPFRYTNCYHSQFVEAGPFFTIVSQLDGRALEGRVKGPPKMMSLNVTNEQQLWSLTDVGQQAINLATGLPLSAGQGKSWIYDESNRLVDARHQDKAIDRGWNQSNGVSVGTWNKHQGPNQKWNITPVDSSFTSMTASG